MLEMNANSLLCGQDVKSHPYLCLYKSGFRGNQLIKHDLYRRQDYPEVFELSHYVGCCYVSELKKLNYNVIGLKKNLSKNNYGFPIYYQFNINKFIKLSDIIVAVLPSTKETENIINKKFLSKMKKNSLLINVGRGISVNEKDLINHLKLNKNFYASLDVFKKEPLPKKNKLWSNPNVIITPHIASITNVKTAVKQMYQIYKKHKKSKKTINDVNIKNGY